jgi:hypothetical protein
MAVIQIRGRRKPGSWSSEKRRRLKRQLFDRQDGICPKCFREFAIELFKFKHLGNNEYTLYCVRCHHDNVA